MTAHNHHAHEHGHHHHHTAAGKTLVAALSITFLFAILEAVGGFISDSLALLGDAGHMFSDAAALGLAAFAAWLAKKPPSSRHSYGMLRAEVVAALVNSVFMLVVVTNIVIAAVGRVQNPHAVDGEIVIWIATAGLIVNIFVAWLLMRGEQTLNVRGALLHVMGDMLGSVAALASGIAIYFWSWNIIDPILSLLICLLILFSTLRLLREVLNVIMEGVPLHLDLEEVGRSMAARENVHSVHDLHIWTLASGKVALSAHVVIADINRWSEILQDVLQFLHEEFDIDHVTLQPETTTGQVSISLREIEKQLTSNN